MDDESRRQNTRISGEIMKNLTFILLSLVLLVFTGCSKVQVSQDYDTGMSFPELRTYSWKPPIIPKNADPRVSNPLLHKRFSETIDRVLVQKGFDLSQNNDFLISYDFSIRSKIQSSPVSTGIGFGVGSSRRYGGIGFDTGTDIRQYDVAVLVIDVYDSSSNTLLWRGTGSEIYGSHPSPEDNMAMVNSLVEAILAQFPPK
jgi:hypothetical protein